MIVYTPFWETLKKKGISTYKLEKTYDMNKNMIHNLKHNKSITMNTLDYLCKTFDCEILDVIEFVIKTCHWPQPVDRTKNEGC